MEVALLETPVVMLGAGCALQKETREMSWRFTLSTSLESAQPHQIDSVARRCRTALIAPITDWYGHRHVVEPGRERGVNCAGPASLGMNRVLGFVIYMTHACGSSRPSPPILVMTLDAAICCRGARRTSRSTAHAAWRMHGSRREDPQARALTAPAPIRQTLQCHGAMVC